jgi:hypothetical protein
MRSCMCDRPISWMLACFSARFRRVRRPSRSGHPKLAQTVTGPFLFQ